MIKGSDEAAASRRKFAAEVHEPAGPCTGSSTTLHASTRCEPAAHQGYASREGHESSANAQPRAVDKAGDVVVPERVITLCALVADTRSSVQASQSLFQPAPPVIRGRVAAITYATQLLVQAGGRLVVVGRNTLPTSNGLIPAGQAAGLHQSSSPLET